MREGWVRIDLGHQRLDLLHGDRVRVSYPVSTAKNGAGELEGSERTPRGAHEVKELIGAGAPLGAVFVGREATGEILTPELCASHPDRDWVLTRVLWLSGLEAGRNLGGDVDSHRRYIYIHGAPDEPPMGEPHSHGCIRMRNEDVVALFDFLAVGTPVQIDE